MPTKGKNKSKGALSTTTMVAQAMLYVRGGRSGRPKRRGQPDWPPGSPRVAQRPRGSPFLI